MFSGNLREATRSVHVSYPVPYIATVLLFAGLALIGLAKAFSGWRSGILFGFAGCFFAVALFAILWSVVARPELLKSERYVLLERMMDVVGDNDMDPDARERLQTKLIGSLSEPQSERQLRLSGRGDLGTDDEDGRE